MINVEIFEIDGNVSSTGSNRWEMCVRKYGSTDYYSDYPTPGHAVNELISIYPDEDLVVGITSVAAYNKLLEEAYS